MFDKKDGPVTFYQDTINIDDLQNKLNATKNMFNIPKERKYQNGKAKYRKHGK